MQNHNFSCGLGHCYVRACEALVAPSTNARCTRRLERMYNCCKIDHCCKKKVATNSHDLFHSLEFKYFILKHVLMQKKYRQKINVPLRKHVIYFLFRSNNRCIIDFRSDIKNTVLLLKKYELKYFIFNHRDYCMHVFCI